MIAIPKATYFEPKRVDPSMNKFLCNAIAWLAKKKDGIIVGSHFQYENEKYKDHLRVFPQNELASHKDVNVYVVNAEWDKSDEDIKAILNFVENGGGLLIGGQAWFYGNRPMMTYPGNRYYINFDFSLQ